MTLGTAGGKALREEGRKNKARERESKNGAARSTTSKAFSMASVSMQAYSNFERNLTDMSRYYGKRLVTAIAK